MDQRYNVLLKTIELLRAELDEIVNNADNLTSSEVVKKSQELDRYLTEYYMLLKQIKEENQNKKGSGHVVKIVFPSTAGEVIPYFHSPRPGGSCWK